MAQISMLQGLYGELCKEHDILRTEKEYRPLHMLNHAQHSFTSQVAFSCDSYHMAALAACMRRLLRGGTGICLIAVGCLLGSL